MTKKVKKHIGRDTAARYRDTEILQGIQLYIFLLLGMNKFHKYVSNNIKDKSIAHNMFTIQSDDSIMCRFCIAFIQYKLTGKTLLDYVNLFSPIDYERMTR